MPFASRKFHLEEQSAGEDFYYAKYSLAPLEKGYATTIGNTIRRVILSSIPSYAITDVRFINPEKHHEFDTIEGVKEDILEILMKLKQVQLRVESYVDREIVMKIEKKGPGIVKAKDIIAESGVEVANPEFQILTLNDGAEVEIELIATMGKGFVPASERVEKPEIGHIVLDGVYSPVLKVNWTVENVRVDKKTDFEKLILEIWTKKSIKPAEALKHSLKIILDHFQFIESSLSGVDVSTTIEMPLTVSSEENESGVSDDVLNKKIEELDLSARALNCLKRDKIETIGELLAKPEEELIKIKNFGSKSLEEVKEKLKEKFGLTFRKGDKE